MSFRIEDILKKDDPKKKHIRVVYPYTNYIEDTVQPHNSMLPCFSDDYRNAASSYRSENYNNHEQWSRNTDPEHCVKCFEKEFGKVESRPSSSLASQKKRRVLFTREQTFELEKVFQNQQYLTVKQREHLSNKIRLSSTQVKIWFQNHRYKLKKYIKDCIKETSFCNCDKCRQSYTNRNVMQNNELSRMRSCTYSPLSTTLSTTKFPYP